jgi:putative protease
MEQEKIGFVSNYFSKISVAAVEITDGKVAVGDTLHFLGHTTDVESTVHSIPEKVREGDKVYKIVAD